MNGDVISDFDVMKSMFERAGLQYEAKAFERRSDGELKRGRQITAHDGRLFTEFHFDQTGLLTGFNVGETQY